MCANRYATPQSNSQRTPPFREIPLLTADKLPAHLTTLRRSLLVIQKSRNYPNNVVASLLLDRLSEFQKSTVQDLSTQKFLDFLRQCHRFILGFKIVSRINALGQLSTNHEDLRTSNITSLLADADKLLSELQSADNGVLSRVRVFMRDSKTLLEQKKKNKD